VQFFFLSDFHEFEEKIQLAEIAGDRDTIYRLFEALTVGKTLPSKYYTNEFIRYGDPEVGFRVGTPPEVGFGVGTAVAPKTMPFRHFHTTYSHSGARKIMTFPPEKSSSCPYLLTLPLIGMLLRSTL
jgi:hypothetical protein